MAGWNLDAGNNTSTQKAEFTKFPVGITKIRVIDGEPYIRWVHWMQQHKRSVNCPGKGCPICEMRKQQKANGEPQTYGMSRRFAINIDNLETGKTEIMEQGVGFFEDLNDIMMDIEGDGNKLKDAIIKVRRRGSGKDDTSYRLDLEEIKPLNGIEFDELKSKSIDLKEYFKPHTNEQILRLVNGEEWDVVMKTDNEVAEQNSQDEEFEVR